jgi:hypothetical protein
MTEERRPSFRRIVVALGSSRESRIAVEASAELAARLRAELLGLFVEDLNLLRMAALPFTRVAGRGPLSSEVSISMVERTFRQAAAEARAFLEAAVTRQPVRWSFRVVRGVLVRELSVAAEAEDLLIVQHGAVEEGLRRAFDELPASVLWLCPERPQRGTVLTLFEPGAAGREHLRAAARFALATERELTVLVPGGEDAGAREREASGVLDRLGIRPRFRRVGRDGRRLREIACSEPGTVLVLPREGLPGWVDRATLLRLLGDPRCSLLVLR